MTTHFFADTAVLQGRSVRHILRSPDTIITTTIVPIAFLLLFVYVFGGAIETGSNSYVTYLLPGQPVGSDIWVALAWCVGILVVAYVFAMIAFRRRISG